MTGPGREASGVSFCCCLWKNKINSVSAQTLNGHLHLHQIHFLSFIKGELGKEIRAQTPGGNVDKALVNREVQPTCSLASKWADSKAFTVTDSLLTDDHCLAIYFIIFLKA